MRVNVDDIKVMPGRRAVVSKHVQELAKSISDVGLLNAITVDRDYVLIAGLHRLEAAKRLGWSEIECTVSSLEGLQAELAEIDENFVRCGLTDMEYNDLLYRRKEIYESLHPETRHGMRNRQTLKNDTGSVLKSKSFAQDTSEKLGVVPRTIERKVQIAKNLTPEVKKIVDENSIGFQNALKLSRLPPDRQKEAAMQLASGEIRSMDDYQASDKLSTVSEGKEDKKAADAKVETKLNDAERGRTFAEDVAYLKSNEKDFSCTPDIFLAQVNALARRFHQEIAWYGTAYYQAVFSALTTEQLDYLRQQTDSVCADANQLYESVERMKKL